MFLIEVSKASKSPYKLIEISTTSDVQFDEEKRNWSVLKILHLRHETS